MLVNFIATGRDYLAIGMGFRALAYELQSIFPIYSKDMGPYQGINYGLYKITRRAPMSTLKGPLVSLIFNIGLQ